jgi:hypothetical protein
LIQHGFNPVIRNTAVYKRFIHGTFADGLIVSQTPGAKIYAATGSTVYIYVDKKIAPTHSPKPTTSETPNSPPPSPSDSSTPRG